MTSTEFSERCDAWFQSVKPIAERLFADGVPADRCLKIAITIGDAIAEGQLRERAARTPAILLPRAH